MADRHSAIPVMCIHLYLLSVPNSRHYMILAIYHPVYGTSHKLCNIYICNINFVIIWADTHAAHPKNYGLSRYIYRNYIPPIMQSTWILIYAIHARLYTLVLAIGMSIFWSMLLHIYKLYPTNYAKYMDTDICNTCQALHTCFGNWNVDVLVYAFTYIEMISHQLCKVHGYWYMQYMPGFTHLFWQLECRCFGLCFSMSTFRSADVLVCQRFGRRFGLSAFLLPTFRYVDVLFVDVSFCRRSDQLPKLKIPDGGDTENKSLITNTFIDKRWRKIQTWESTLWIKRTIW